MSKKPFELEAMQRLVNTYGSAARRQKEFNLDLKYMSNLITQTRCAYSGELFTSNEQDKMTLERFDNDLGYVKGNVIAVKSKYNSVRSNYTKDELISKRDQVAARIVRSVDSKAPAIEETKDSTQITVEMQKVLTNITNREKHLAQLNVTIQAEGRLSPENKKLISTITARIAGGHAEYERLRVKSVTGIKRNTTLSEATKKVMAYDIVIQGLNKFSSLSILDKMKLKKGLPLNASIIALLRGKV